ncbi:MAG: Fur family transcriptional regulator [Bacteroidales bacterium]
MHYLSHKFLKEAGLSITKPREKILSYLLRNEDAISGNILESELRDICNRSTVYRNLSVLSKANLIHRIYLDGESRYKIHPGFFHKKSNVNHPHFECKQCGRLFCLHDQDIDKPELPEGFIEEGMNYIIYGYCNVCNKMN